MTTDAVGDAAPFTLDLPATADAIAIARMFVAAVVQHLGCAPEQAEDAKLAVSEASVELLESVEPQRLIVSVASGDGGPSIMLSCSMIGGAGEKVSAAGAKAGPLAEASSAMRHAVLRELFADVTMTRAGAESRISFSIETASGPQA
ncbi:MAG TPA: hypothetical protein VGH10_00035 [Actinomycetota bacterium]